MEWALAVWIMRVGGLGARTVLERAGLDLILQEEVREGIGW